MKIFYAVQATGNGHIARAAEILPFLNKYGQVDLFFSGSNSQLAFGREVKYKDRGVSIFYDEKGGLDYKKTALQLNPFRLYKTAMELPVENYDLIINDFETITSLACRLKKIPSVQFGHQASFQSKQVPRPEKENIFGEWILKNYCRAKLNLGLHFKPYDNRINWPIIKNKVIQSRPKDLGHVTVYLPHLSQSEIRKQLKSLTHIPFQIFCKDVTLLGKEINITWFPIDNEMFTRSLIDCHGALTGAGFETPSEALYMRKKLMIYPIAGQYEQLCNAEALKEFKVPVITSWDINTGVKIDQWYQQGKVAEWEPKKSTPEIVEWLMTESLPFIRKKRGQAVSEPAFFRPITEAV